MLIIMVITQEPGVGWEGMPWPLFKSLSLKATCPTPPPWPQFGLSQHLAEVGTSTWQSSEVLFQPQALIRR